MRFLITQLFLFFTIQAQSQWGVLNTNVTSDLIGIHFQDSLHGIAVGQNGTIIQTEDGGSNWKINNYENYSFIRGFLVDSIAYAIADEGVVYKSWDYGRNWELLETFSRNLRGIYFFTTEMGFICGSGGKVFKTEDGGENWEEQSTSTNQFLREFHFFNNNTGFVCGDKGNLFKTENAGQTWESIATESDQNLWNIHFPSDSVGFISGGNSTLLKTIDGGTNWSPLSIDTVVTLRSIHFYNNIAGITIGDKGLIFLTLDGGESWGIEPSSVNSILFHTSIGTENWGYICGANGVVLKLLSKPVSVSTNSQQIKEEIKIYPNPARHKVTINLKSLNYRYKRLRLFNMNGQIIHEETLHNGISFDLCLKKFNSGIYLIELVGQNGEKAIQKLVIQ